METLIAIFVILIVILVVYILFCRIAKDIAITKMYNNANETNAKVIEELEKDYISEYGSFPTGVPRIKIYRYRVEYEVDGKKYQGILATAKKEIKINDIVKVRYVKLKNTNEPQIVTDVYKIRLKRLLIGTILGLLLAVAIIIFKLNDI